MPHTIEERKAYHKKWYQANKDKIAVKHKKYRETEGYKISQSKYRQSELGKIRDWKGKGMISDNWHQVYETYIMTTCCNYCNKEFINNIDKHLDHNHDTGEIRGVLCRSCNLRDIFAD